MLAEAEDFPDSLCPKNQGMRVDGQWCGRLCLAGHNVHDRLIRWIGDGERFVLLDVDRVALFQDFLSTVAVNHQRSAHRERISS